MKFEEWFEEQYGKRTHLAGVTDRLLESKVADGEDALIELRRRQEWDLLKGVALKSWTASRCPSG